MKKLITIFKAGKRLWDLRKEHGDQINQIVDIIDRTVTFTPTKKDDKVWKEIKNILKYLV